MPGMTCCNAATDSKSAFFSSCVMADFSRKKTQCRIMDTASLDVLGQHRGKGGWGKMGWSDVCGLVGICQCFRPNALQQEFTVIAQPLAGS
jgi:hypothetical protein